MVVNDTLLLNPEIRQLSDCLSPAAAMDELVCLAASALMEKRTSGVTNISTLVNVPIDKYTSDIINSHIKTLTGSA